MIIRCNNCNRERHFSELEKGRKIECCCSHRFVIDESCIVDDSSESLAHKDVTLGNYDIGEVIGEGSMGTVYKSIHPQLKIPVAVKVLRSVFSKHQKFSDQFIRAARICAKFDHPNIVRIYECGEDNGVLFLVMEFIDGVSTFQLLEEWYKLEVKSVVEIAIAMSNALIEAKKHGVIHRDIKPENIMRNSEGVFKLADLGLAIESDVENDLNEGGEPSSLGTLLYMSPEQIESPKNCNSQSDIYSLGVTLYELLTGNLPFHGMDKEELLFLQKEIPAAPSDVNPDIPAGIDIIIWRCIEYDRAKRYKSPEELLEDLKRFQSGRSLLPSPGGVITTDNSNPEFSQNRNASLMIKVAGGIGLLSIIIMILAALFLYSNDEKKEIVGIHLKNKRNSKPTVKNPANTISEEQKKAWDVAIDYANKVIAEKIDNVDLAIKYFSPFIDIDSSEKFYRELAQEKIEELEATQKKVKKEVLSNLAAIADEYKKKNEYEKIITLYRDYKGCYKRSTSVERVERVDFWSKAHKKYIKEKQAAEKLAKEKATATALRKEKGRSIFFATLLDGNFKGAKKVLADCQFNDEKRIAGYLDDLINANALLLKGATARLGKVADIHLKGNEVFLKLKEVKDGYVIGVEELDGAKITHKFKPSKLSWKDREFFALKMSPVVKATYFATACLKEHKYIEAEFFAKAIKGSKQLKSIGKILAKQIRFKRRAYELKVIAKEFGALFKKFNLNEDINAMNIETVPRRLGLKKLLRFKLEFKHLLERNTKSIYYTKHKTALLKLDKTVDDGFTRKYEQEQALKNNYNGKPITKLDTLVALIYNENLGYDGSGKMVYNAGYWSIDLSNTRISTLSFLDNINVKVLKLSNTQVNDLVPLIGQDGLEELWIDGTDVKSLRPIDDIPLKKLVFSVKNFSKNDLEVLKNKKSLTHIGNVSAKLFWSKLKK